MQEFILEQLLTLLSAGSLQRTPGRKAAVAINTAMALLGALKVAVGETAAEAGDLKHPAVEKALQTLLRVRGDLPVGRVSLSANAALSGLRDRPRSACPPPWI